MIAIFTLLGIISFMWWICFIIKYRNKKVILLELPTELFDEIREHFGDECAVENCEKFIEYGWRDFKEMYLEKGV